MAKTIYRLAGVPLDYCKFEFPLYRGSKPQTLTLQQSLRSFERMKAAVEARKGIVSLSVSCSSRAGTDAPRRTEVIEGIRVLKITKRSDATYVVKMTTPQIELVDWVCKRDLNVLYRDGFLDGTRKEFLIEAIKYLLDDPKIAALLAPDAFADVIDEPIQNDLLTSGSTLNKPIDDILSRFGYQIANTRAGKLRIAGREDIGGKPTKKRYTWIRGKAPAWETEKSINFRRARKFRFYYKRRHAIMAIIAHDGTNSEIKYFNVVLRQCYEDGDKFLSLAELLEKYGVARDAMNDRTIGESFMSENFEGTPIARDGSANRDALLRIVKNDWRRLYKVEYTDPKASIGAFTEMDVGVFKRVTTPTAKQSELGLRPGDITGDTEPSGAVRGKWAEFLNVLSNANLVGLFSIMGSSTVVNHSQDPGVPFPGLPTAPYTATWEQEEAGILRLKQEKLADNNYSVLAECSNVADMRVTYVPSRTITDPKTGKTTTTRWGIDAPARSKAKLQANDAIALLVGTQRSPNNADRWETVELDGFADGDVDVVEFEVSDQFALFDFMDKNGLSGAVHDEIQNGSIQTGAWLNETAIRADATRRRDQRMREIDSKTDGPGVALGIEPIAVENVGGSIDSITLQLDGPLVTTEINCANLASSDPRKRRADRRAAARGSKHAGKRLEAV